ncbi:hypothetical protein THIOKS12340063 [Thiocapsa sp. KS1]|nr:hypothetical protein THIOKS12340063 [Thiocapsa sp. KS1]
MTLLRIVWLTVVCVARTPSIVGRAAKKHNRRLGRAVATQGLDQDLAIAVADVLALGHVDDLLGDVGGVIADALQGMRAGQQTDDLARRESGKILLAEEVACLVGGVEESRLVFEDTERKLHIEAGDGLDAALEHAAGVVVEASEQLLECVRRDAALADAAFTQDQGLTGDAHRLVPCALDIAGNPGQCEHDAQIDRGRLTTGDDPEDLFVRIEREKIDLGLAIENAIRLALFAVHDRGNCGLGLLDDPLPHVEDDPAQLRELLVVTANRVTARNVARRGEAVVAGHQPNRPVM